MSIYGQPNDWDNQPARVAAPKGWKLSATSMVCPNPNCGYRGPAAVKAKGSRLALWILLATFILPGLIYAMFFSGQVHCCPACRTVVNLG
jgi:hypothetical protein